MSTVWAIQHREKYNKENVKKEYQEISRAFGIEKKIKENESVLIKPNFVAPFKEATTDLFLLECVIAELLSIGAVPIVAESSGFEFSTDATIKILGIDELCNKYRVRLINLDNEQFVPVKSDNPYVPEYLLPEIIFKVDKIINMPCLKGHSLTKVTFSIKNLFGLLNKETRRKIHASDLEFGISCLKKLIKVDIVIVSGLWNLINAVYSDASYQGIILIGDDMMATDICCCKILGIDYKEIQHISQGLQKNHIEYVELTKIEKIESRVGERKKHFEKQNYLYKMIYNVDIIWSKIFHCSLIPYLHYYLGIRPHIDKKKCTECGKCQEACPVSAIVKYKIDSKKCLKVRCLKCFEVCPNNAIKKIGLHKE